MIICETCSCGAKTEAPATHQDALGFLERWRRSHRCTQPNPDVPAGNDQPIVEPTEPHPADIGFRLTRFEDRE